MIEIIVGTGPTVTSIIQKWAWFATNYPPPKPLVSYYAYYSYTSSRQTHTLLMNTQELSHFSCLLLSYRQRTDHNGCDYMVHVHAYVQVNETTST